MERLNLSCDSEKAPTGSDICKETGELIGISFVVGVGWGEGKGYRCRNNLCQRPVRMWFIVGITRRPRGKMWSLRPRGRNGPDHMGLRRSFLENYLKIKGKLLHNFKKSN